MMSSQPAGKSKERQRERSPLGLPDSRWQPISGLENEFYNSIQSQTTSEKREGRAVIFNLSAGGFPPTEVPSVEEFRKIVGTLGSTNSQRHLIILEDLGFDWVQPLLTELHVPEDVFAQHWAGPAYHSEGRARVPLGQDIHRHYILGYEQPHAITIKDVKKSLTHQIACNASRSISFNVTEHNSDDDPSSKKHKDMPDDSNPIYTSRQLVSFWASEEINGSWVSLLLVDPPLRPSDPRNPENLTRSIYTQDEINGVKLAPEWPEVYQNRAYIEPLPRLSIIRQGSYQGYPLSDDTPTHVPLGHSMFDDLGAIDHGFLSKNPSSAGHGSRLLVLARTAATFQGAFSDAYNLALSSSAGIPLTEEMSSLDYANLEKKAWNSKWEGRRFTKLWEQRENLELLRYNLRQNIEVIERLSLTLEETEIDYNSTPSIASVVYRQQQNNLREWQELDKTADYINQVIVRTTESYLQTVQARESQASNFQAMSVGRLTKMATIFVPVSLAAAIFSMGGSFAAGNSKFWIFWVVSLPIVGILVLWMFGKSFWKEFKKLQEKIKDSKGWRRLTGNLKIGPSGIVHDEEYARQVQGINLQRRRKKQGRDERQIEMG